ncbi:hypothetical protein MKW94_025750, partial [Papaver nudicaule]|nr:hypothetical protein [Papaver nudicaule]
MAVEEIDDSSRRRSSRIQKLVKKNVRDDDIEEEERVVKKKKITKTTKINVTVSRKTTVTKKKSNGSNGSSEVVTADVKHESKISSVKVTESVEKGSESVVKGAESVGKGSESVGRGSESVEKGSESAEKSDYAKVRDTIRAFNKHYLHFVQEEELRVQNIEKASKNKASKNKKGGEKGEVEPKRPSKRPDLKAITKMIETSTILYPEKRPGHLPGVDVGHQFYSRAEMVVVGFHNHWLNGIDFMGTKFRKKAEFKHYTFPIAISIVLSGQYEDDLDNCDDVIYTGQGGNDLLGNKSQIADQVMKRGNLALKNNIEQKVPVRVIRGLKCPSSYCGKVYTYDGLYHVVEYWAEKGVSGYTIFKYRLKRIEGQPPLTTTQVQFARAQAPKCADDIRGLVCKDISGGLENIPIPATNLVDEPAVAPTGVKYITTAQVSASVKIPTNAVGCKCRGACVDPRTCACAKLNGSDFPYVCKDGG